MFFTLCKSLVIISFIISLSVRSCGKSELITSRDIETLNYKKAKRIAKKNYKIKCESVVLGYGYNNPVYEIRGSNKLILLDYDSFERVYERKIQ